MKNALVAMSVAGLLGASGFVAWTVFSRPDDAVSGAAAAFDFKEAPPPSSRPLSAGSEQLKDAVADAASPRPISVAEMAREAPPRVDRRPPVRPFLTPELESGVRKSKILNALLRAPARFLVAGSAMKSPRALNAFLGDKAAVDAYMNSTLVRVALNSPAVAKALIGNAALVRAFLGSPALRDPGTVKALVGSRMLAKMLDCPGVQGALADPAVIRSLASDPVTIEWIGRNPQSLNAIATAAPALAGSLSASRS